MPFVKGKRPSMQNRTVYPKWIDDGKMYPPHLPDQKLMLLLEVEGLTPYELALFMRIMKIEHHHKRCMYNTEKLAELSNMSMGSVYKAKKGLYAKGLITIKEQYIGKSKRVNHVINTYLVVDELLDKLLDRLPEKEFEE